MGLLALDELQAFLGGETSEDSDLLERILAQVELQFLRATNRLGRPFQDAQSARVEVQDGTGSGFLFTDYPIAALTVPITLGYASPWDESLDPSDASVLQFLEGGRRVARVDGGIFGALDRPGYVRITYDAAADKPEDVKLLFKRFAGAIYHESNTDEASSERRLGGNEDLPLPLDLTQAWDEAVRAHWQPRL